MTFTLLDSARFRYLIGSHTDINPRSIHGHIIGEHGDSELPVWSLANIAGTPIDIDEDKRKEIFENTKNAAYEIIEAKGSTSYAIALALDRIVAAILGPKYCGPNWRVKNIRFTSESRRTESF